MSTNRHIRVEVSGDIARVWLVDTKIVDSASIEELDAELSAVLQILEEQSVRRVIVEMSGVEFLCSAALNILITLATEVRERGGRTHLKNLNGPLRQVFRLTRLDALFDFGEGDYGSNDDDWKPFDGGSPIPKPTRPSPDGLSAAKRQDDES